jgi:hypothetical protein
MDDMVQQVLPPTLIICNSPQRVKPLIKSLSELTQIQLTIIPSCYVKGEIPIFDYSAFKFLYNRFPNYGEVGCAIAHHSAYKQLEGDTDLWFLILEDSARLGKDFSLKYPEILDFAYSLSKNIPAVINLYSPRDFVIVRHTESSQVAECLTLLRMAKGYLMNSQAVRIATAQVQKLNDVADWPEWITGVRQYCLTEELIYRDRDVPSSTGNSISPEIIGEKVLNSGSIFYKLSKLFPFYYVYKTKRKDYLYRYLFHSILLRVPSKYLTSRYDNCFILYFKFASVERIVTSVKRMCESIYKWRKNPRSLKFRFRKNA